MAAPTRKESRRTSDGSSSAGVLLAGVCGAGLTLGVAALVLLMLAGRSEAIPAAQRTGTRLIGYAMMLIGGLAGAALGPGISARRREARRFVTSLGASRRPYPLAVLGGVVAGLAALGAVFPMAELLELFCKLLLVLIAPPVARLSAWVTLSLTIGGVLLLSWWVIGLLDRQIHLSRVLQRDGASIAFKGQGALQPAGGALYHSGDLFDRVLRVVLGAGLGFGLTLHLGVIAVTAYDLQALESLASNRSGHTVLLLCLTALVGAWLGAKLGAKLDEYLRERLPRRRASLPGSWYGYTPVAWIGGIVTARVLAGVAVVLAQLVVAPVGLLAASRQAMPFTVTIYFATVLAWMLIIGRGAARAIDSLIEQRLTREAEADAKKPAA